MDADRPTLRALLWCPAAVSPKAPTVGAALDKGWAIACARRLAAKHHRNAEPGNITLKEY